MGRDARARAKNRDAVLTIRQPCARCDALVVVDHYRCFAPRPLCARCAKGVGVSNPLLPNVPIIGQPCAIHTWFPTLVITCNCEGKQVVTVVGLQTVAVCPSCRRGYQLLGVKADIRTGQPPHFDLNIVLPGPPPPASES